MSLLNSYRLFIPILFSISAAILLSPSIHPKQSNAAVSGSTNVMVYPTYGYLDGDEWVVPMRVLVFDTRSSVERVVTRLAASRYSLNDRERQNFRNRLRYIVADSDSRQRPVFVFEGDPDETEYRVLDEDGSAPRSDLNGLIKGTMRIPADKADMLLENNRSDDGWLTIRSVSRNLRGTGRIQLIEPEGLSVISDIDDTIKITEIPAGGRIVVQNTFFNDYTASPGMNELYEQWNDATFHYVSGAPWQLFQSLNNFLVRNVGFPEGTFHMKNVRKNLFNVASWRDLRQLATNELVTFDQKIDQITELFETFPGREFILVGDSGEMDPEIYSEIRERFPGQVQDIFIRDVVNDRENNPERLEGMRIIRARAIEPGVTQFSGSR